MLSHSRTLERCQSPENVFSSHACHLRSREVKPCDIGFPDEHLPRRGCSGPPRHMRSSRRIAERKQQALSWFVFHVNEISGLKIHILPGSETGTFPRHACYGIKNLSRAPCSTVRGAVFHIAPRLPDIPVPCSVTSREESLCRELSEYGQARGRDHHRGPLPRALPGEGSGELCAFRRAGGTGPCHRSA